MKINPILLADAYKISHPEQYPEGTEVVYSNTTARKSRMQGVDDIVVFGIQYLIAKYLIDEFNENFFQRDKHEVISEAKAFFDRYFGPDSIDMSRYEDLHDLGYLPLRIKALPEGTVCPTGVPFMTIVNTKNEFYWLTNAIETLTQTVIWNPLTAATIARQYRLLLDRYANETCDSNDHVQFQAHDFSMRGMSSVESGYTADMGHLLSFVGSDTLPGTAAAEEYYYAGEEGDLVGCSVPATEHAVMCAGGEDHELETFDRLISEIYPKGIVSIVSDTWNLWDVLRVIMPALKDKILARDGKVVIRPDSGNPLNIICGYKIADLDHRPHVISTTMRMELDEEGYDAVRFEEDGRTVVLDLNLRELDSNEQLGALRILEEEFGSTKNEKGYFELNPKVGLIYGDAITLGRAESILERMKALGFASNNIVFGVGSYCVHPDTPILMADWSWKRAGDIAEGDEIIAFNEDPVYGEGRQPARKYEKAKVTVANHRKQKRSIELTFDGDETLTCSTDHPLLVWGSRGNRDDFINKKPSQLAAKNMPRGPGLIWKKASELQEGDQVAYFGAPWEKEESREAGWLEGMYDGEGTLYTGNSGRSFAAWKVSICQNRWPVLDRIRKELSDRGFEFYEHSTDSDCVRNVITGGFYEHARFLGVIDPVRLKRKGEKFLSDLPALKRGYTYHLKKVVGIEDKGRQPVASLTTSSGTFITNGFLTHNTYQHNTRDTFSIACKATYVEVNGEAREIFKDPITDDGTKKSAKGLLQVVRKSGDLILRDQVTPNEEESGLLEVVFEDGTLVKPQAFKEIRNTLAMYGNTKEDLCQS